jgi:hypothetical protein
MKRRSVWECEALNRGLPLKRTSPGDSVIEAF